MARPPITFFESSENLRSAVRKRNGRSLSSGAARDATVCLQQGRLFFEAAERSGLEIRPLQLYYGSLAFAKAVTLISNSSRLATLPRSHGLRDITLPNARLAELSVQIKGSGTFQSFNDTVALENRYRTHDASTNPISIQLPATSSRPLEGLTLTLKDILSRFSSLHDHYVHTFKEPAMCEHVELSERPKNNWTMRVWLDQPVTSLEEACIAVDSWRDRFPVLQNWRVTCVTKGWGKTVVEFCNQEVPPIPLCDQLALNKDGDYSSVVPAGKQCAPEDLLLGGSLSDGGLSSAVRGLYIAQPSILYLGIFLLSSLVRYRPEMWIHALTRGVTSERPADDHMLSLIEDFLTMIPGEMRSVLLDYLYPNDPY